MQIADTLAMSITDTVHYECAEATQPISFVWICSIYVLVKLNLVMT